MKVDQRAQEEREKVCIADSARSIKNKQLQLEKQKKENEINLSNFKIEQAESLAATIRANDKELTTI